MLWLYAVIIMLTAFCLYLSFKLYFSATNIHEIVYSLLFQIILLRDMAMLYDVNTIAYEKLTALKLQSFWPQGRVGSLLITRHNILTKYVQQSTMVTCSSSIVSKHTIKSQVREVDDSINKYVTFDMHRVSMYTFSMIDNILKKNQIDSLLAVKGFIYTIQ
jgi:hypothetical protein